MLALMLAVWLIVFVTLGCLRLPRLGHRDHRSLASFASYE